MDTVAAAQAIVEIAISKMSLAVREVSVAKGYDPRDFALVASGGAGPLHVIAIARELHIPTVIVPLFPSHFSALGMLLADERHDFIRTYYSDLAGVDFAVLVKVSRGDDQGGAGRACATRAMPRSKSSSICATSARNSRSRCRSRSSAVEGRRPQGDPQGLRRALRAPLRAPFAGRAGRDGQHAARRHRQARQAAISLARQDARGRGGVASPRGVFFRREEARALPGLPARCL